MDLYARLHADASRILTDDLQHGPARHERRVEHVQLGINWTALALSSASGNAANSPHSIPAPHFPASLAQNIGLAFSPSDVPRTLSWPGTLRGRPVHELLPWISSWIPAEAAVGLAALNAVMNGTPSLLDTAQYPSGNAPAHLRVFEHFTSQVKNRNVVVIGRYPGLDRLWSDIRYQCLERKPLADDLPDTAAEYCLPQADWVFITASSIANKTLPRLLQLSRSARVVLMGPSLPWWPHWRDFGVEYLAGVRVTDPDLLWQVVAEGGGTRLFGDAVQYCLHQF